MKKPIRPDVEWKNKTSAIVYHGGTSYTLTRDDTCEKWRLQHLGMWRNEEEYVNRTFPSKKYALGWLRHVYPVLCTIWRENEKAKRLHTH